MIEYPQEVYSHVPGLHKLLAVRKFNSKSSSFKINSTKIRLIFKETTQNCGAKEKSRGIKPKCRSQAVLCGLSGVVNRWRGPSVIPDGQFESLYHFEGL